METCANQAIANTGWSVDQLCITSQIGDVHGQIIIKKMGCPRQRFFWTGTRENPSPQSQWKITGPGAVVNGKTVKDTVAFPFTLDPIMNRGLRMYLSEWLKNQNIPEAPIPVKPVFCAPAKVLSADEPSVPKKKRATRTIRTTSDNPELIARVLTLFAQAYGHNFADLINGKNTDPELCWIRAVAVDVLRNVYDQSSRLVTSTFGFEKEPYVYMLTARSRGLRRKDPEIDKMIELIKEAQSIGNDIPEELRKVAIKREVIPVIISEIEKDPPLQVSKDDAEEEVDEVYVPPNKQQGLFCERPTQLKVPLPHALIYTVLKLVGDENKKSVADLLNIPIVRLNEIHDQIVAAGDLDMYVFDTMLEEMGPIIRTLIASKKEE